jgi:hypothetical protein
LDPDGEEEGGVDLALLPISQTEIEQVQFDLRFTKHGCGLGLSLGDVREMDWSQALRWRDMLAEALRTIAEEMKKR